MSFTNNLRACVKWFVGKTTVIKFLLVSILIIVLMLLGITILDSPYKFIAVFYAFLLILVAVVSFSTIHKIILNGTESTKQGVNLFGILITAVVFISSFVNFSMVQNTYGVKREEIRAAFEERFEYEIRDEIRDEIIDLQIDLQEDVKTAMKNYIDKELEERFSVFEDLLEELQKIQEQPTPTKNTGTK